MSDYLDWLAGKSIGAVPLARPVLAPAFAPGPLPEIDLPVESPSNGLRKTVETADASAPVPDRTINQILTQSETVPEIRVERDPDPTALESRSLMVHNAPPAPTQPPEQFFPAAEITPEYLPHELPESSAAPDVRPETHLPLETEIRFEPPGEIDPRRQLPVLLKPVRVLSMDQSGEDEQQNALVHSKRAALVPTPGSLPELDSSERGQITGFAERLSDPPQAQPETVVRINIGRIDIRTSSQPPSASPSANLQSRPAPAVSLDQYLKARREDRS